MKKMRIYQIGGMLAVAGVIISPVLASAAVSSTASSTINATVGSVISMTTAGTVPLAVTPTGAGVATSASDSVSVSTNNTPGYTLTLADTDGSTALVKGGNTINAHSGTFAVPSTLANNSWGYRVDNVGSFGAGTTTSQSNVTSLSGTWAGVPATGNAHTLKSTSSTASADITTVWYAVKADTTNPSGVYTDSVTYTATAK